MLEQIRQKTMYILESHKDISVVEQLELLKSNLGVNDEQSTILHSEHFDKSWNKNISIMVESFIKVLPKKILSESFTNRPTIKIGDRVVIKRLGSLNETQKNIKGKVKRIFESIKFVGKVYDVETDSGLIVLTPFDDYVLESEHNKLFLERYSNSLVKARFEQRGNWVTSSKIFIVYMTPSGKIVDIKTSSKLSPNDIPFSVDDKITMGDLYDFEKNSEYDLSVNGSITESHILYENDDDSENEIDRESELYKFFDFSDKFDDDIIMSIMESVPHVRLLKILFDFWSKRGVDFGYLDTLSIIDNSEMRAALLRKYSMSTNHPIPVELTLDCNDLAKLFKEDRDYNLDYIENYLCGRDPFDNEFWYDGIGYDDFISDNYVDSKNMETISQILGLEFSDEKGRDEMISHILGDNPQTEYEENIIEEKSDEIREIKNKISHSYGIELEDAAKRDMYDDILNKLTSNLDGGELVRDDSDGSYSYIIGGDLRDFINDDDWDNSDFFENHPDYGGSLIETLIDWRTGYITVDEIMGDIVIGEKYSQESFDGGIEVNSYFFSNYYSPTINKEYFNGILSDYLSELT